MTLKAAHNFFSASEQEQIRTAVAAVENECNSEIVPIIIDRASSYSSISARNAFMLSMAAVALTLWLAPPHNSAHLFWQIPLGSTLAFMLFWFLMDSLPALKRRLVPPTAVDAAVSAKALEHFTRYGIYKTREHSGILILVCLQEHRVQVLADEGINAKVDENEWQAVADTICNGLKQGEACASICAAIEHCKTLLETHFTFTPEEKAADTNELPDLIIAPKG